MRIPGSAQLSHAALRNSGQSVGPRDWELSPGGRRGCAAEATKKIASTSINKQSEQIHWQKNFNKWATTATTKKDPVQNSHYRMLGLGAHYKPLKPNDFIVPWDVVQKQIVAVEFCKAVRSKTKIEIAVCDKEFWSIFDECFFLLKKTLEKIQ